MTLRNPRFGWVRIAQRISHAFGIEIDNDVVRRVLSQHYRPDDVGSNGLVMVGVDRSIQGQPLEPRPVSLRINPVAQLLGAVVMDIFTRRIVGFGVARDYIDGVNMCRMFNHAVSGQPCPRRLSIDHDPLFRFHRWLANLPVLESEEIKAVPYVPGSHPFIERLIGTVRREYLDRLFFWNSVDLTGSWRHSATTTTNFVSTDHLAARRPPGKPERHRRALLHSTDTRGRTIVGVYSRFRSQFERLSIRHPLVRVPSLMRLLLRS